MELTIKDDERLDPPISADAFNMLGILSIEDYAILKERTIEIAKFVAAALDKKGLHYMTSNWNLTVMPRRTKSC